MPRLLISFFNRSKKLCLLCGEANANDSATPDFDNATPKINFASLELSIWK
jgi:hypothetical protein